MVNGPTTSPLQQFGLLGLVILIVVSLFAFAFLVSEFVFQPRLAALSSSPTPARIVEQLAPPPSTPTTRPALPSLVVATGAPASSPTLVPSPLPALEPAEPTAVIIVLPIVHGPAGAGAAAAAPPHEASLPIPAPATATVEVHVSCPGQACTVQGLQAVLQWRDASGAWHDVPGWSGTLGADGRLLYGVEAKDLGTGPFRWAILGTCPCGPLAVSRPFSLPSRAGETLPVEVVLGG